MKSEAGDVKTDLSRRSFLIRLAVAAIGSATAMSLDVNAADAAPDTYESAAATDNFLPGSKRFEAGQQVDPDDPLQHFAQPYYRHRRRVARRVYRRSYRYTRRYYRRGRRYARRTYRRIRRRGWYY